MIVSRPSCVDYIVHHMPVLHFLSCWWIIMKFVTSWTREALISKLYCPSVTTRPADRFINFSVKFSRMYISSCGIILALLYLALYLVVWEDGMVGAGVWCVPTLVYAALTLRSTLGVARVSTLGGSVCLSVRSTFGGALGLFRRYWNRVEICLRDSNCVSPIFENGSSRFGCSIAFVDYAAASAAWPAEDMNGMLVWWGNNSI